MEVEGRVKRCKHKWKVLDVLGIKFRYCRRCSRVERLEPSFIRWLLGKPGLVWRKHGISLQKLLKYAEEEGAKE